MCPIPVTDSAAGTPSWVWPPSAALSDWLTCFPGLAMLTCDAPGRGLPDPGAAASTTCGRLTGAPGVRLRWPDGELTDALAADVSGLGAAGGRERDG